MAGRGKGREGWGREMEERGGEAGSDGQLEQGRRLAKAGPDDKSPVVSRSLLIYIRLYFANLLRTL